VRHFFARARASAEKELHVRYSHLRAEVDEVRAAAQNWRELPLATVARGGVFAAECFAWFCVGEIVGRGFKLTGYDY
jgi:F-type H+-transporting ATPase subunit g